MAPPIQKVQKLLVTKLTLVKEVTLVRVFTDSIQATIENRKSKGQGIVSEILSIIEEIPLGKHTTTVKGSYVPKWHSIQ